MNNTIYRNPIDKLIYQLNPDKIQCKGCHIWMENTPYRKDRWKPGQFLCCTCENLSPTERISERERMESAENEYSNRRTNQ